MITLNRRRYERIVSYLINGGDIRAIADQFTMDRVFYFHVLRDIASGDRSPNYRILKRIAASKKVSEDFIVEQARAVINYTIPNYQSDSPDYYKTLEVSRDASDEEIRRKWIELMRSHHPDMAGTDGLDTAMRINEAYEVLGNAEKREAYDRRFLPPVPVVVPYTEIPRGLYVSAPIALVILIALVYASGSGLIFKSQEEKEQLAKVIEKPALPNTVYRGDAVESRTQKLEESVALNQEQDYTVPPAQKKLAGEAPAPAEAAKTADEPAMEIAKTEGYKTLSAGPAPAPAPDTRAPAAPSDAESLKAEIRPAEEAPAAPDTSAADAEKKAEDTAVAAADREGPVEQKTPESPKTDAETAKDENKDETVAKKEQAPPAAGDEKPEAQIIAEVPAAAPGEEAPVPAQEKKGPVLEKPVVAKAAPEKTPSPEKSAREKPGPVPAGTYYTVRNGDSLWTIARKFNTSTAELARLNGITGSNLGVGEKLLVSGEPVVTAKVETPVKQETKTEITTVAETKKAVVVPAPEPVKPAPVRRAPAGFDTGLATTAVAREADMARPVPIPVSAPDKNTLYNFVSEYKTAYMGRDLPRLKTLFSPDAVENGVSMSSAIKKYDSNFSALDIINYDIKVHRALVQNNFGFVRGDFFITYKDIRTGTLKNSRGNINWKLAWQDDEWKILELNYKIESTGADG